MLLSQLLDTLRTYPTTRRLWVAYSGGLDSQVLLQALAQLRAFLPNPPFVPQAGQTQCELRAIHIHHGLQTQAEEWVKHCQDTCEQLQIPCEVLRITIPVVPRHSLEAQARTARYDAITQLLSAEDIVLTAHHADDQAETVLLQLLRGAGAAGLAAMPPLTRLGPGWLARPLLNETRAQLLEYAHQAKLHWIEDPSNANTRFDRNFLRHDILPKLREHWPNLSQTVNRVARHQAEANELLEVLATQDLSNCQTHPCSPLFLSPFSQLTAARQRNALRRWLKQLDLPLPTTAHLQRILEEVLTANTDRQPLVKWPGGEVRRHRHQLYAMPNLPSPPAKTLQLSWTLPQRLTLPLGELTATEQLDTGLAIPSGTELQIRFRQGGEKLYWHGHQREVKKLLQASPQPPWLRAFIPLIYLDNTLVAIPNIGTADQFTLSPVDKPKLVTSTNNKGWNIQWHYSPLD